MIGAFTEVNIVFLRSLPLIGRERWITKMVKKIGILKTAYHSDIGATKPVIRMLIRVSSI